MEKPKTKRIPQIIEILEEFDKNNPSLYKLTKLFKEMFEDLVTEEEKGYELDLKVSCLDIDNLCVYMQFNEKFRNLKSPLQEIIKECTTLNDYPSKYSLSSPKELLTDINKLFIKYSHIEKSTITLKDKILKLYNEGKKEEEISIILQIDKYMISRTILLQKKSNEM